MKELRKHIQWFLCIILPLAVGIGFFRMGGKEIVNSMGQVESSIIPLSDHWVYTVDESEERFTTSLPGILTMEEDARRIILSNTLPEGIRSGDVLRLNSLSGWVDIYIDGELRTQYGNHEITELYWYENASAMLLVKLTEEDAGKEIQIHTGSIDAHHLAIQREPRIGSHRDFLMSDVFESAYGSILITIMVISSVLLLCTWLFFYLKKQNITQIPSSILFLLMMTLYYNVSNIFLLEVFSYAPAYFGLNDFIYYVMNVFIPIAGYLVILPCIKLEKGKALWYFIIVHIFMTILAFILQVVSVEKYEPVELSLMLMTVTGYLWLIWELKRHPVHRADKWFIYPVFICILAYVLDYGKYMINLDWMPDALANYLQVASPFMLFLPVGMIIYLVMLLVGIVHVISERQMRLALEAKSAELRATLSEKEFQSAMESMNQVRRMRHDIEHHFSVIHTYLAENNTEDAVTYIEEASALIPKRPISGKNLITGSFIEQYRLLCEQNDIRFTEDVSYDEDLISNKTTLGIILGNGLKNAFESAATAKGEQRFVRITGKRIHDNIAIVIQNGFRHEIKANFMSTRAEGRGFGISNIRDAAERCGGYLECSHENSVFTLEVVLVIQD